MSHEQTQTLKESILVVDDTPANLQLLTRMLFEQKYEVRFEVSGHAALQSIQSNLPDLILLDVMMPEMNGYEVCQQLKADDRTRSIPVIFLSACNTAQDKVEAFAIGGVDYITKPFHANEVIARIENQLQLQRLQKQLIRQNEQLRQEIQERESVEAALRQSRECYRLLSENSTDLISRQTLNGILLYVTPASRSLLGYEQEEMIGHSIYDFFHPDDAAAVLESQLVDQHRQNVYTLCYRARCRDQSYVWVETTCRIVHHSSGGEQEVIGVSRNITERKQAEVALSRQLDRALLLQQITEAIRSHLDSHQIFATAATQIGQAFGGNRCIILTYRSDPQPHMAVVAEYVESGYVSMAQAEIPLENNLHGLQVFSQDQAVSSPNIYIEPLLQPVNSICRDTGLKSMLAVRTSYQKQVNGAIALHQCDRFRTWTSDEIELLEAIAAQLGIALAQARLLEQEQQQRKVLDCQVLLLRQEIQERRQAETELRASEERWLLAIQGTNDGIADVDLQSNRAFFSARWKEILGYEDHEISDNNAEWSSRIHPEDFDRTMLANQNYLSRQTAHYFVEYRLRCKDGSYRWVKSRGQALWDDRGVPVRFVVLTGDITARKQTEAQLILVSTTLSNFSNNLKHLHRLSITSFKDTPTLYREYLKTGCEVLGFSVGTVGQVYGKTYRILAIESEQSVLQIGQELELANLYCQETISQSKTIAYNRIGENEQLRNSWPHKAFKIESYLSTPIFVGEAVYGVLCFFSSEVRDQSFGSQDKEIIELMAQSIGKVIDIHQAEIQQQQAEEEIQLFLTMTRSITAASDFNQALAVALEAICEITGWIYGEVWLPASDDTTLECSPIWCCNRKGTSPDAIAAVERFRQMLTGVTFHPDEGIAGRVWHRQQPEWIANIDKMPPTPPPNPVTNSQLRSQPAKDFGMKGRFGVPITIAGDRSLTATHENDASQPILIGYPSTVVAVLVFFTLEPRPQDARLIQVVAAVAAQLGTVLAQKRAAAEIRALFSAMTDLVVVRDATGRCLKVAPTRPVSSRPADETLGKTLHETLPSAVADRLLSGIQNSLAMQQTVNLEHCLPIRGQNIWLSTYISPLSEDSAILVSRDISEAKRNESELQHQQEALRLIVEGTAAQTGSEFFRSLVRYLAEVLQVRYACVTELSDDQTSVKTLAFWQGDDFGGDFRYTLADTPCEQVLSGEICYYPDSVLMRFPQDQRLTDLKVESYFGIPLTDSTDRVLGHLMVLDDKPMQNDPNRHLIVRIFAARAGAELERKLAEDALHQSVKRERTILRVVERIRQTLDVEQIFRAVTQELRYLLDCDRIAIYHLNPDWSGGFVAESVAPGWVSLIQKHIHDPELMTVAFGSDRCVVKTWTGANTEHPVVGDRHLQATQEGVYRQSMPHLNVKDIYKAGFSPHYLNLLEQFQARAYLTVPIFQGSQLWGLLACYQNDAPRNWKDNEVSLVVHISTQLGVALQQANLLGKTQQQSAELERAKDTAESANRAKSEFLSSMSHELRTPLNAIFGFAQLMSRDPAINSENRSHLNIINRSSQHLLELINDVLEMSKIEAGRTRLNETSFDLYHLLDNLEKMLRPKAIAKRLTLTFERSPQTPQYIATDEGKLRQVLINLLGNAIKFTRVGQIILRVSLGNSPNLSEAPAYQLMFEIEDTGLGIDATEMQQLFSPFVQTQSGRQSHEGTGLGLTISRKFVRLMGGDITAKSVPDQGSLFAFYIWAGTTFATDLPMSSLMRPVIAVAPHQPNYRLLIVEDQVENSQLLLKLLAINGFEVALAQNGQEAIDLWQQWEPHLILMDMRMPVMNGYEATQRIKATVKGQKTVIIAVTGSAFEEDRAAILAVGCDDFIRKPFQVEDIFTKLADHLGVQYLYGDTIALEEADSCDRLTTAALTVMPQTWIDQLRMAASGCSDRQISELIKQIPAQHGMLARSLTELTHNFRFEEIVELTSPVTP